MASFCKFLVLLVFVCSGFGEDPSCSSVKSAYRSKRLTEAAEGDVPTSAVDGKQALNFTIPTKCTLCSC